MLHRVAYPIPDVAYKEVESGGSDRPGAKSVIRLVCSHYEAYRSFNIDRLVHAYRFVLPIYGDNSS
jgi:hypothetical protein